MAAILELVSSNQPVYNSVDGKFEWDLTLKNIGDAISSGGAHQFSHFDRRSGISPYHDSGLPKLALSSDKATSILPTNYSSWNYTITFSEDISVDEEFTISVELAASHGVLINERFLFFGTGAADVTFFHFGSVCGIADGLYSTSTEVKVVADLPSGTTIYLYKCEAESVQTLIGSGTISDSTPGYVLITPTESIVAGLPYIAYGGTVGFATYGASVALPISESGYNKNSGWKDPNSLFDSVGDETTYEAYLANGGEPIADYYDPKHTINRAAKSEPCVVDFDLTPRFNLNTVRDGDDYIITVINPSPYLGNIRLSWDGGELTSDRSKTYSPSGTETHSVVIFHETDDNISAEMSFEIDVTINSYTSDIWGGSYGTNSKDNKHFYAKAFGLESLDYRIEGIDDDGVWITMDLMSSSTHLYQKAGRYNFPSGVYILQFKRTSQPSVEVSTLIRLDW